MSDPNPLTCLYNNSNAVSNNQMVSYPNQNLGSVTTNSTGYSNVSYPQNYYQNAGAVYNNSNSSLANQASVQAQNVQYVNQGVGAVSSVNQNVVKTPASYVTNGSNINNQSVNS